MAKVLLIDADSKIPNLALMKLSTYYKDKGYNVDLKKLDIPYFPWNVHKNFIIRTREYEKTFCSCIFNHNYRYVLGVDIDFGGTGYSLHKNLDDEIENLEPDYTLYNEKKTSYGFLTRGCIRNCSFCVVPEKEGKIREVNNINDIAKFKFVNLLDNNILAHPEHKRILNEMIDLDKKYEFSQGLDIRLIDKENSDLIRRLKYARLYTFAFDFIELKDVIEEKIKFLDWVDEWKLRFYVYVHPDMELSNVLFRLKWLKEHKCLPYLMRDLDCWFSEYREFYIDLASYCNQYWAFKGRTFEDFLTMRMTTDGRNNPDRLANSIRLFKENWDG